MTVGVKICEAKDTIKKYENLGYRFVSEENVGEGYLKLNFRDPIVPEENNTTDIQFQCGDYEELYSDKVDCLFYCDIPYKGTKQYGSSKNFDYDRFWNWAENMSERNIVLVSEHEAPSEWECIWQQEVKRTIDNTKRVKVIEKLFEIRE